VVVVILIALYLPIFSLGRQARWEATEEATAALGDSLHFVNNFCR
jgi:hypothetical protein